MYLQLSLLSNWGNASLLFLSFKCQTHTSGKTQSALRQLLNKTPKYSGAFVSLSTTQSVRLERVAWKTLRKCIHAVLGFQARKVKCSIFAPFSGDSREAQSCWDSNMNQGQLTHSQSQRDLTGTRVKAETGFSIQMGERVGQTDSPARLNADRLPTAVRTKGMKMTTLPKLATDETCTAEWPWCTSPICLCVQVLHNVWQRSLRAALLTYSLIFILGNSLLQLSFETRFWRCLSIHQPRRPVICHIWLCATRWDAF